ncbi:MAG TPA: patatin-like phospholipase family protein [Thermoanaerobaculia bacterium]|jgi:hypothetical protein
MGALLPLSLGEVLHEEYVRLYGLAPALPARWALEAGEILNARELARKLAARFAAAEEPVPPNIARWQSASGHDPAYKAAIAAEVNAIFDQLGAVKWLYEHPAFKAAEAAPYDALDDADNFDPDGVYNVNRQMFDVLFRDETRAASDRRYAEVVARIHKRAKEENQPRTALSISGGGIRSATFALGVMQGLAARGILETFDFVSTVSGGGYIGSWLSSWMRRDPWGIRGVSALLGAKPIERLEPEPAPLRHLRAFSNYLTPRLGGLSADTWALVATYLRNLLLNWIVLIPLLAGILAVPRLIVAGVMHPARDLHWRGTTITSAQTALVIGLLFLAIALFFLTVNRPIVDTQNEKRKPFSDGDFLKRCLAPFLTAAIALMFAWAWYSAAPGENPLEAKWFIAASIASCLFAFLWFLSKYLLAPFVERRGDPTERRSRTWMRIGWELGASLFSGALGGWLAWLLTDLFDDPVKPVQLVGAVRWPIEDSGGLTAVTAMYVCFAVPLLLGVLFLQSVIFVGAASHENHDFDREWWARAGGWVLIGAIAWIALTIIAIYGPVAIYHLPRALSAVGGGAGAFSLVGGWSAKSGATKKSSGDSSSQPTKTSAAMSIALSLAVPVFVLYILALISAGTTWALQKFLEPAPQSIESVRREVRFAEHASREYPHAVADEPHAKISEKPVVNIPRLRSMAHLRLVQDSDGWVIGSIVLGLPLLALLFSRAIGVNVFSMHAMYRNRLVRAYLGASRWNRHPNGFTGFDADDNLLMHQLRPEYVWAHSFRDFDLARKKLLAAKSGPLRFLFDHLENRIGDIGEDLQAFAQSLNALIATEDLPSMFQAAPPAADRALRALRNRRFIEQAFDDVDLYPSPMPLLCVDDLLVSDEALVALFDGGGDAAAAALRAHFKIGGKLDFTTLLGEINDVIATQTLADDPAFAAMNDAKPFLWSDVTGVHRMIENRLRIEAALPKVVRPLRPARPLHVVNICLNLTGGEELGWQERKGESLTVSPLASGNYRLGYRDTRKYGEISLGTAVTISGAAASPNMGYHSSPALAFLMTLFNVRLGWWLGNPGLAGNDTYERRNPRSSILPFLYEATGNSTDKYGYVYLSDGGHFENLGLYEMVLRRCHRIVISDAGADPRYIYDDLGNAVRKIRIDLGIPIDLDHIDIMPADENKPGKYCATGTINYKAVDGEEAVNGELVYIKPVVYADEGPRDVLNYSKNSPDFPHESTADQFFSESQFESYRRLGLFTIDQICASVKDPVRSVSDLIDAAEKACTS